MCKSSGTSLTISLFRPKEKDGITLADRYIELNNEVKIKKDDRYQFEKDKEAVKSYFIDHVNQNTVFFHNLEEKLGYLVENEYYDKALLDQYSFEDIKSLFKLAYSFKFRFESFMSAFKFYNNYALKTNDQLKYLERYEDRIVMNALFFGEGDIELAKRHVINMIQQNFQPATPTFLNVGRDRAGEMVSCFLLDTPDTTEGIMYVAHACAQLSRNGGGVGINLSKLRAQGESIQGRENAASSPIGIAKMYETIFGHFDQGGQRKGSGVGYLNIFHADIEPFLETKKINADENARLKTLSIGVVIPSKFYELAEDDKPYFVFYPHNVHKEYGIHLDDMEMDEWYDKLIANKNIRKKKMDARQMLIKIAQTTMESGYPYIMNVDNANKYNAVKELGRIKMSNLCTEIFQIQEESDIKPLDQVSKYGLDISCNLASLNIINVLKNGRGKGFREIVHLAMWALNTVAKNTSIGSVPTVKKANDLNRSVGLGVMNLHGTYATHRIAFESMEAKDFANVFFMIMNFYSIEGSMEVAKKEKFIFNGFEKSEYANGNYFKKYKNNKIEPVTAKVIAIFEQYGIYIPTPEDWANLEADVKIYGLAHMYRLAIAPTGNISYVQNATASIAPITEQVETRKYGDSTTHYPMPGMTNENLPYYKEAYDMDMFKFLDLVAVIQQHIDQGISTILYVTSDKTTRDLARLYIYAHKKGLKSLYYTRTRMLTIDECLSCSV
jgi:ribonucleoside-diphosphate reductase alpha chain